MSEGSDRTGFAGNVSVEQAFEGLSTDAAATLIDVRTRAEWSYVGVPDLRVLGKEPILAEWQSWPTGAVAPDFVETLEAALAARGVAKGAPLYFLCRSGARSHAAALAMAAAGHGPCFNVADGFEGPLDGERHRGTSGGWKAAGLPWVQT